MSFWQAVSWTQTVILHEADTAVDFAKFNMLEFKNHDKLNDDSDIALGPL